MCCSVAMKFGVSENGGACSPKVVKVDRLPITVGIDTGAASSLSAATWRPWPLGRGLGDDVVAAAMTAAPSNTRNSVLCQAIFDDSAPTDA
jgi:hypothetical protein